MKNESTTELLKILKNTTPDKMTEFIDTHSLPLPNKNIFSEYISKHDISASEIYHNCQGLISKSYVYDILSGKKEHPSRDVLLILCIAAHMDRKMTRRVLENYQHRDLYAKDTKDIIIATHINNKEYNINIINEELNKYNITILEATSSNSNNTIE